MRAGLGVLLTVPRTADPDRLVRVAGAAEEADLPHAVAFTGRGDEGYAALEQTAAAADSAPWRQVTVAGCRPAARRGRSSWTWYAASPATW